MIRTGETPVREGNQPVVQRTVHDEDAEGEDDDQAADLRRLEGNEPKCDGGELVGGETKTTACLEQDEPDSERNHQHQKIIRLIGAWSFHEIANDLLPPRTEDQERRHQNDGRDQQDSPADLLGAIRPLRFDAALADHPGNRHADAVSHRERDARRNALQVPRARQQGRTHRPGEEDQSKGKPDRVQRLAVEAQPFPHTFHAGIVCAPCPNQVTKRTRVQSVYGAKRKIAATAPPPGMSSARTASTRAPVRSARRAISSTTP